MISELTEKQIRDRVRFLSDKIDNLWVDIEPKLKEFDSLKSEFDELFIELDKRGLLNGKTYTE